MFKVKSDGLNRIASQSFDPRQDLRKKAFANRHLRHLDSHISAALDNLRPAIPPVAVNIPTLLPGEMLALLKNPMQSVIIVWVTMNSKSTDNPVVLRGAGEFYLETDDITVERLEVGSSAH